MDISKETKAALYKMVHQSNGITPKEIADVAGVSHNTILNYANPNMENHLPSLKAFEAMLTYTENPAVLKTWAHKIGLMLMPVNGADPPHFKEETNTETTTEITTEKKKGGSEQPKAENPNDYPESFEKFWKAYPGCKRKTKKSESFKTFKKYESDFNLDLLLTILEKLKNSKDWIKDDGDYIPAPQAWLNQRQWENDYWVSQINQNHGGQPAVPTQQSSTQPLINLPLKPKGFLGGSNV